MELETGAVYTFQRTFTEEDFDRFAALSGDDNPIHVDPDFAARTRFGRTVAHGMLLYSTLCAGLGTHFPGPGTVQLEQEMMFNTPTFVGEQITIHYEVMNVNRGKGYAEISTKMIRPGGKLGLEGRTLVWLPDRVQVWGWQLPVLPQYEILQEEPYKGLEIGQTAQQQRTFSQGDLIEYTRISQDTNPIFTDPDCARLAGFTGTPLPGGLLAGLYSYLLGTRLPGRGTNWLKQTLHFPKPSYPNEPITASVEIIRLRPEKNLVNLLTVCKNPRGERVCVGQALVLVKDLEQ